MTDLPAYDLFLGQLCVNAGHITSEQLDDVLETVRAHPGTTVRSELLHRGWVSKAFLDRAVEPSVELPPPSVTAPFPVAEGPGHTVAFPPEEGPTGTVAFPSGTAPSPSNAPTVPASAADVREDLLPEDAAEAAKIEKNLFGKYILIRMLGSGGMAVVYLAWDTLLHQRVALKFIKMDHFESGDAEEQRRMLEVFLAEARLAVKLNHPHIARVFELGRVGERHYMSQQYIDGPSLHEVIHGTKSRSEETRFYTDPKRNVTILRDIASAMAYAHTLTPPIIHRDLKPSNVMLDSSGRAYVVDFGLAKEVKAGVTSMSGLVKGTPKYMAPEQAEGRSHDMDGRTDVWALGVILYEMLTGRGPFEEDNLHRLLSRIINDEPSWPRHAVANRTARVESGTAGAVSVPHDLEVIAMKCLQKDRRHRYAGAGDLVADLDRFVKGETIAPPAHTVHWMLGRAARGTRKHRGAIVAAVAGLVVAAAAFFALRGSTAPPAASGLPAGIAESKVREVERIRDAFLRRPSEETLKPLVALLGNLESVLVPTARAGLGSWWADFAPAREAEVKTAYGAGPSREWLREDVRLRARTLQADLALAERVGESRNVLDLAPRDWRPSREMLQAILAWKGTFALAADIHPWATFKMQIDGKDVPRDAGRQENATPVRIGELPVGAVRLEFARDGSTGAVTVPEAKLRDGAVLRVWGTLDQLAFEID